jgi:hypothetical protein
MSFQVANALVNGGLVIGRPVQFAYANKRGVIVNRTGVVEYVHENAVCVKDTDGKFKSFTFNKIKPFNHGWDKVTA